jgi:hypothetical protein
VSFETIRINRRTPVKTITAIAADKLGNFLTKDFRRIFGSVHDDDAERLGSAARSTIECLARSDALYHNYEHTLQVTMVGCDILHGMMVSQRIEPEDYSHLIVACLLHDIGYVRGILKGDTETEFVIDAKGTTVTLPRGASDAALSPYHVDRSKLFAFERLEKAEGVDVAYRRGDRDDALSGAEESQVRRKPRAETGAGRRFHRPARRSALLAKSQRALLRIRGDRNQPAARIFVARRHHRKISVVFLELRLDASRRWNEISEHDGVRPAMDRQPAPSHSLRRACAAADGPPGVNRCWNFRSRV